MIHFSEGVITEECQLFRTTSANLVIFNMLLKILFIHDTYSIFTQEIIGWVYHVYKQLIELPNLLKKKVSGKSDCIFCNIVHIYT